jgi:hypothetical protein
MNVSVRPVHRRVSCLLLSVVVGVVVGGVGGSSSGCAEDNTLTGSIGTSHDLDFDDVALRLLTDQAVLELRYLRALDTDGPVDDVVARVVCDVPDGGVVPDEPIDLIEHDGVVQRVTAANDPFPPLRQGSLTFTVGGVDDGDDTRGRFAATFDNGRTLNGTFATTLVHARFDDGG